MNMHEKCKKKTQDFNNDKKKQRLEAERVC